MTVSTAAQLLAEIAADLPSANPAVLTAASLRTVLGDMVASLQANPTVNAQVGTTYTVLIGDLGKLVTFSNASPVAVTLPQATGSFATFNVTFLNLGAGAVTVTPTTSTINGSSNVVIATNGCVRIVADGANYQVTSGITVTANGPASSLARILDLTQSVGGTDTVTHQFNSIAITDTADLGANVGNGLNFSHSFGGSTAKGSRQAVQIGVTLTAPTNAANTKHFYAALATNAQANSGDGGTNTGGGAKGSIIGSNPSVTLNSGATNLAEASGIQVTMFTLAGSSVSERSGIEIADNSGAGGVQGATFDDAIVMGNVTGSPGWKIGWALDATNFGAAPIATTGTAIKTVGAQTMDTFLDASSATVTTFINGPGGNFIVDGNGFTQIKSTSSFGWAGSFSRILSPGDGVVLLQDHTNATFARLQLGGTTSSFPAVKRNGTGIDIRLADDSAFAPLAASNLSANGAQPARYVFFSRGVNFNAGNTDTSIPITLPTGVTRYVVTACRISNASASLSAATAGLFTAAAGGGVAIVTAASAITVTATAAQTNNNTQSMTTNNATTESYDAATLFFRVAAAVGSAATGDVSIEIQAL